MILRKVVASTLGKWRLYYILQTFVMIIPSALAGHSDVNLQWIQYARTGIVNGDRSHGGVGYYRLNRRTDWTFRDLRLFAYGLDKDSYVYLRFKSSNRYEKLQFLYGFTTLSYQQNTRANVSLRYHYNQGFGIFVTDYTSGHINMEVGHAYDLSDYLNDTRKTSYIKTGLYWDHNAPWFSTKLELESFYQISETVEANLSRTQLQAEIIAHLGREFSLVTGYEMEVYPGANRKDADSWYLLLGWVKKLPWTF